MSMFRRPTEESSDSDSTEDDSNEENENEHGSDAQDLSQAGSEELIGTGLTATETLSSGESISVGSQPESETIHNAEHHRNMILASLLEEFYRTRAAELFNASEPGSNYHRQSPEVQPLARTLFYQASQDLAGAGILSPHVAADSLANSRKQYLVGFDNLGLQNLKDQDLLPASLKRRISHDNVELAVIQPSLQQQLKASSSLFEAPMRSLALQAGGLSLVPHPGNDMPLASLDRPRSHYQSSFHETRLLGKGGFGRVYQTYNFFDNREYAVKKIPLSPKLSQRYREHGHGELHHVLREVQALAQLDHCNVVRYHATWVEEPSQGLREFLGPTVVKHIPSRKLLDNKPAFPPQGQSEIPKPNGRPQPETDDGILFAADSNAPSIRNDDLGWSSRHDSHRFEQSSMPNSDIFTDGAFRKESRDLIVDDPHCYVLHVQMSMYPTTLTQYLQPNVSTFRRGSLSSVRRHCFHLVPSLRIILGILTGLQYVHAKGLIHRDIKPSNIFLSSIESKGHGDIPEGFYDVGSCPACQQQSPYFVNPRIGDFGLVADLALGERVAYDSSSGSLDKPIGTQFYHPPSPKRDRKNKSVSTIDEKLDVFALGVILTELLCPCDTSMERLDLLKTLQNGCVSEKITGHLADESSHVDARTMAVNFIQGMTNPDHMARWSCSKVRESIQEFLEQCETRPPA